ncbi:MAG: class II aldolase/adducin family protein [Acidobacteriaceae bacterium]
MDLASLRTQVYEANSGIYSAGLVTMHSGNASGIDKTRSLVVIKPSGVDYEKLTPEMLVVTDLQGRKVQTTQPGDDLNPSVDLPHHLYLYRHCSDIGGIIHTHSNYATSFALLERPLPVYLTAIADEFGAAIPCIPYTDNVEDHIGEAIVKGRGRAPAVFLGHHGVFAFGKDPRSALKTALMLEDVSKTCHLALLLGKPTSLSPEETKKME